MSIEEIIEQLNLKPERGFQLTKRRGFLTSTWAVYIRKGKYYFFDITEEFIFDKNHRYTKEELVKEFKNAHFEIDDEIS